MIKQKKGSLTVEASVLVPMIFFLIAACIYLLFYMHDQAVMQSYALRKAEALLWGRDMDGAPVFMMKTTEDSGKTEGILSDLLDMAKSRETAQVHLNGRLSIGIGGAAALSREVLDTEISGQMIKINYTDDRLQTVFLQRKKE